jgi:hypothetical protein
MLIVTASVVPYQGFKTADGDIFVGGANDRLFGILCEKLDKSEWSKDPKYVTNNERVRNRQELEDLIEAETTKRTTQEWLKIFEGSGLPYAAVNDVLDTLNHEHSKFNVLDGSAALTKSLFSQSPRHGPRDRSSCLRSNEGAQSTCEILQRGSEHSLTSTIAGRTHRPGITGGRRAG